MIKNPSKPAHLPELSSDTPLSALPGIGPKRSATLSKAGLHTVDDLIYYFPFRYEDRRDAIPIGELEIGRECLIEGTVIQAELKKLRKRGSSLFTVVIKDPSGSLMITWFNQHWLADKIKVDQELVVYGKVEQQRNLHVFSMNSPQVLSGKNPAERGIVPVYQRIRDMSSQILKKTVQNVFDSFQLRGTLDLPESVRVRHNLLSVSEALQKIHVPEITTDLRSLQTASSQAHKSLIYAEFFSVQAGLALLQDDTESDSSAVSFQTSPKIRETLKRMLPFSLTEGQRTSFKEIVDDMINQSPMRRLLQGDVGSGKTIVALLAAALAIENGYQAAFMAPTEILADQHIESIKRHCGHTDYRTAFLTGSLSSGERKKIRGAIAKGEADLIVGTHALIQDGVTFSKLGLAIIDEQHRFGVLQRAALLERSAGMTPDLLIMTATPIPRSLTLTLFGDLSVSQILDKPPGRKPVTTAIRTEHDKPKIISFLKKEIRAGRQVYWVCPRIDDNPEDDIRSVNQTWEEVSSIFGASRVGLLHGKLRPDEKERVMADFSRGKVSILVTTTVIEVGVNVPNANVMIIENAERFGLSQLHQLRGRVGRGTSRSYCILMYNRTQSENAMERLKIMEQTEDGFLIAEKDLELRGPGDFLGTRQSGIPTFRVGNLIRDAKLLEKAREDAFSYIKSPDESNSEERAEYLVHLRHQWLRKYGLVLAG